MTSEANPQPGRRPLLTKSRLNFAVDLLAFIAFVLITTSGLLMRWTLPPGSGGRHGGGLAVWGMDRHQWGNLHFWLALALLGAMALHILLHWRWILHMVGGKRNAEESGLRLALGVAALAALVLLALLPFLSGAQQRPGGEKHGEDEHRAGAESEQHGEEAIRGRNSVAEAAEHLGLTVPEFLDKLGLPAETSPDEHLGQLVRAHGLSMTDVRKLEAK